MFSKDQAGIARMPRPSRMIAGLCVFILLLVCTCAYTIADGETVPEEQQRVSDDTSGDKAEETDQMGQQTFRLGEAIYPEGFSKPFSDEQVSIEQWWDAIEAKEQAVIPHSERIRRFAWETAAIIMADNEHVNPLYSPVNLWLCAGLMAHMTSGEAHEQLLNMLGAESDEELDEQLFMAFLSMYRYDSDAACVPGASLWLNEDVDVAPSSVDAFTQRDHASVFRGNMRDSKYNAALRAWLSEQTRGMLDSAVSELQFREDASISVSTTLYYKAAWADEFDEERTFPGIFHGTEDAETNFMHKDTHGYVYAGSRFTAIAENLMDGSRAVFLLPDEGTAPEELLEDEEALSFLEAPDEWEQSRFVFIHLSMPEIDKTDAVRLDDMMKEMGVTGVFDAEKKAFDGVFSADHPLSFSNLQQFVRFKTDERGIEAAAVTIADVAGAMLIGDEIDFNLDRPFLYVLETDRGLPLFMGIYHMP